MSPGTRPTCSSRARRERVLAEVKPTHLLHLAWYVVPGKADLRAGELRLGARRASSWCGSSREPGGKRVVGCGFGLRIRLELRLLHRAADRRRCRTPSTAPASRRCNLHDRSPCASHGRTERGLGAGVLPLRAARASAAARVVGDPARCCADEPAQCSHGRQIRDYMHVQDVADGLVAAARQRCAAAP